MQCPPLVLNPLMRIGYLGPTGTFTHIACEKAVNVMALSDTTLMALGSLNELFESLDNRVVDAIFTPIENSVEGPVNQVLDHLIHSQKATIDFMFTMAIEQSILSMNPHIKPHEISAIVSMPHAIAQCYSYIKTHCPNATIYHAPSTAGAVPMIDALSLPKASTIVIGHRGISDFFPIHLIQENVQDQTKNTTEFGLIVPVSTVSNPRHLSGNCMLAFSTLRDAPGSLLDVLTIFKAQGINLTKILSRPEKSSLGTYIFVVAFCLDNIQAPLPELLAPIKNQCLYFQPLGIYSIHHD